MLNNVLWATDQSLKVSLPYALILTSELHESCFAWQTTYVKESLHEVERIDALFVYPG